MRLCGETQDKVFRMYIPDEPQKNTPIATEIRKRLFYSFLFSTFISLGISCGIYQSTEGFETKQVTFLLVIGCFFLCIINFILSLTAYLNLNNSIRKNIFLSAAAFGGLPLALLLLLTYTYSTNKSENDTLESFIMLAGPSIFYILALAYNFFKFREAIKVNKQH
jgi:hypothetical protein